MALTLDAGSVVSGYRITLIVDNETNPPTAVNIENGPKCDDSSDYGSCADDFTTISLNGLIEKTISDPGSDIGRQMKDILSKGESIPKVSAL